MSAELRDLVVLVVDDHLDGLELAELALHLAGARVLAAPNGRTALRLFDTQRVDVIVSDLAMPELDGYDMVRTIRARRDDRRGVPALAVSGRARYDDVRRALEAGFDAHVSKPTTIDVVIARVRQLVEKVSRR